MPLLRGSGALPQDWRRALTAAASGLLLVLAVLWPTLLSLAQLWSASQTYQFAWLVVPLTVYLLGWHDRQATLRLRPQADLSGVAVAVVAALCWGVSDLMNIDVGRQFALVLAVQGIVMSALGWRSYWKLFPPLALLFFMVPGGDLLQPVLRHLTVKVIEYFAVIAQLPHSVDGFVVWIGKADYVVLNECAGLPYFMLATFLGYAFGLMLYRSVYKIAALTLFGAFIGILSNALRVSGIVLTDWIQGSQMPLSAHANFQWAALLLSLGLLFYVLNRLDLEAADKAPDIAQANQVGVSRWWPPVVAGLAVFVIAGGGSWLAARAAPPDGAVAAASLPGDLAGWQVETPDAAWSIDAEHDTRSLDLTYRRDGKVLAVRIVETLKADAKLQESELAPGATSVWHENSIKRQTACDGSVCLTVSHIVWEHGQTQQRQHVYSTYAMGKLYTTSKLGFRAAQGWARLTGGNSRPRLIGFTLDAALDDSGVASLAAAIRSLQTALDSGG